ITVAHDLRICRIDPNIVHVAMRALKSADYRETFASVFTQDQSAVRFENTIGIFWIDNQPREIEGPPNHPITFVALLPGYAAIIRNEERARGRFDQTVNPLRVRRRDCNG